MNKYLEIKLLPDPDFSSGILMNALFSRLHLALAAQCEVNIGISFPDWKPNGLTLGALLAPARQGWRSGENNAARMDRRGAGPRYHGGNHGGPRSCRSPGGAAGPGKKQSRTRAATADAPEKHQRRGRARDHTRQHRTTAKTALSYPDQPKHGATVPPLHRTSAAPGTGRRGDVWCLRTQPDRDCALVLAWREEWHNAGLRCTPQRPPRQTGKCWRVAAVQVKITAGKAVQKLRKLMISWKASHCRKGSQAHNSYRKNTEVRYKKSIY